jgi:hypothetical protein
VNAKAIYALACLTASLIPLGALAQTTTEASITKGTITVPGKDIIFKGQFTLPPDSLGGFQIEITLPQKDISAGECGPDDGLVVQMGDAEPIDTDPTTPKNPVLVKKKLKYFHELMTVSQEQKTISINIQGRPEELTHRNGKLYAPYCAVAISGFDK